LSTVEQAVRLLKLLEGRDWKILYALERFLPLQEDIPPERVSKQIGVHVDEVDYRLRKLEKAGLIKGGRRGYSLITTGLDAIALNALAKRRLISALGRPIGVGKESDVYEAFREDGSEYAVKFFRIGRISFRAVKRKRGYLTEEAERQWLLVNMQAAKTEYSALKKLHPLGVSVPRAVARERHTILMDKIRGVMLADCSELDDPRGVLLKILDNIRLAYVKGGVVNSDLSEYNVLYDGESVWLIDWPQAVDRSHVNSAALLDRDALNILRFFKRRFRLNYILEAVSFYIRGWSEVPGV